MVKDWQELALRKLGDRNTMPSGIAPNKAFTLEDTPNFQVYEFSPNRKLDQIPGQSLNRGKRYLIAGREWSILQQTSLLKAIHDILGERLGYNFTFEEWFKQWEKGFPFGINKKGSVEGLISNYPSKTVGEKVGWREIVSKQPAYLEWTNPNPNFRPGYRVIEYFPDQSEKGTSFIMTGSDIDIIQQIISYHITPQISAVSESESISAETPIMSGHPMVTLYFSSGKSQPNGKRPVRTQFSFRLMSKVELAEHAYSGEDVLTKTDIDQLSSKIKIKFSDSNYKIERGDTIYSYTLKQQGYRFWCPLRNRTEAEKIFRDILSIQNHVLKPELISEKTKPARASTIPDRKVSIAGKDVTLSQAYKNVDIWFTHAILKLPTSKHMSTLVVNPRINYC